jgi:hypothetical protein
MTFERWAQANMIGTGSNYQAAKLAWEARGVEASDLQVALVEMLESHSMESIGVNASARRIKAKEQARAAILKANGE